MIQIAFSEAVDFFSKEEAKATGKKKLKFKECLLSFAVLVFFFLFSFFIYSQKKKKKKKKIFIPSS